MHAYVKSTQVPQLPHSAHLSELENKSVNKLASRELRQQETPIGIFFGWLPYLDVADWYSRTCEMDG